MSAVQDQIDGYIGGQAEPKRGDMAALHAAILDLMPGCRLWFLDGRDGGGKAVANPNIGYGGYTIRYADGTVRAFYQIGLSANTSGISVYILGIRDKAYLAETYKDRIGKASVTGYCIRFRALKDIDLDELRAAVRDGLEATAEDRLSV